MNPYQRFAFGLLAGPLAGVLAFVTMSVIFFGLGQYSRYQLTTGAVMGSLVGLIFGPPFIMLRPNRRTAILIQVAVCTTLMVGMHVYDSTRNRLLIRWQRIGVIGEGFGVCRVGVGALRMVHHERL